MPRSSQHCARCRCAAWQGPGTAQGGHPTTVSTTIHQADHGTETLWPWGCMAREHRACGTRPDFACPFLGLSPCTAVQANCFSKGSKTPSGLSHCKTGAFSGALLGMLAHVACLARSPVGVAWKYFWLPASGVSLNGPAMPALSSCLSLV